jgi:hypothetical protein
MSQVGFEHTILVFERVKTVHVLERAATVIGTLQFHTAIFFFHDDILKS